MIKGAVFWDDRERHFVQLNNPTEEILRKAVIEKRKGFLETCGPTSALNCLAALGYFVTILTPGGYKPQPEEVLTDFFNDPSNDREFERIRAGIQIANIPENRVPQYYPYAVRTVFEADAEFRWLKNWKEVTALLQAGAAIQLCLKVPGHYVAALAYDIEADELVYNDPWPDRAGLMNKGFNERMGKAEYEANVEGYVIVYPKRRIA